MAKAQRRYTKEPEPECYKNCQLFRAAQTQARLQLMEEVRQWQRTGKSVKQLLFRLQTVPLTFNPEED